jgi:hypothetical protein
MTKTETRVQIGTVEFLRDRVYPMPGSTLGAAETVLVEPGVYPIFTEGGLIYWEMDGHINRAEVETRMISGKPGDSLNLLSAEDAPSDIAQKTTSRPMTVQAFRSMLAHESVLPVGERLGIFKITKLTPWLTAGVWPDGFAPAEDHPFQELKPRRGPLEGLVCEHRELPGALDRPCGDVIEPGQFYVRVVPTPEQQAARSPRRGRDWWLRADCAVANGWVIELDSPSELG